MADILQFNFFTVTQSETQSKVDVKLRDRIEVASQLIIGEKSA